MESESPPPADFPNWKLWLMPRIWNIFVALTCIVVCTTLVGLLARLHWAADIFANLRVQQTIGLAGIMAGTCCFKKWKWLALQMILVLIHLPWFATAFTGKPRAYSEPDLVVMVSNVLTSNSRHDLIINQVRVTDPDVFAILELGSPLYEKIQQDLAATYPHHIAIPQDRGNFGIGLWSRYPMMNSESFALNLDDIESVESVIEKEGHRFRIIATHPLPPMGGRGFQLRNEHLARLATRIRNQRTSRQSNRESLIVMGDLNLTPWSPIFTDFESRTALLRAGRGRGLTPTWYAKPLFPFGLKLDHILLSEDLSCAKYEVGDYNGSDHRPVIVGVTSTR